MLHRLSWCPFVLWLLIVKTNSGSLCVSCRAAWPLPLDVSLPIMAWSSRPCSRCFMWPPGIEDLLGSKPIIDAYQRVVGLSFHLPPSARALTILEMETLPMSYSQFEKLKIEGDSLPL